MATMRRNDCWTHELGKVCPYSQRLAELDRSVLEELVVRSIAETRRRQGMGR